LTCPDDIFGKSKVTGVDMSDEQLAKAEQLCVAADPGSADIQFVPGRLEDLPFQDGTFDVVISNGVINLCPDKPRVFSEAAWVLTAKGRLALADIVAIRPMPETVTGNPDLWSAYIGGAAPETQYRAAIEPPG
jgi:arsenite methyltransferase